MGAISLALDSSAVWTRIKVSKIARSGFTSDNTRSIAATHRSSERLTPAMLKNCMPQVEPSTERLLPLKSLVSRFFNRVSPFSSSTTNTFPFRQENCPNHAPLGPQLRPGPGTSSFSQYLMAR